VAEDRQALPLGIWNPVQQASSCNQIISARGFESHVYLHFTHMLLLLLQRAYLGEEADQSATQPRHTPP